MGVRRPMVKQRRRHHVSNRSTASRLAAGVVKTEHHTQTQRSAVKKTI